VRMYYTQAKALFRGGFSAQPLKTRTHVALAKIPRYVPSEQAPPTRYFCNMTRDRLKPTPHQGFSDCTHVRRLKNRGKPHGEAVLIFWLGELQVN
ncbi:MAG: hypothetical protein ACLFWI_22820, partial [Coleofasciculus sp.]|uniref:hypothetical protein n=1 Tax=Coleofasciculus sp. TaxID=3100458 RepID=UPI003A21EFB6